MSGLIKDATAVAAGNTSGNFGSLKNYNMRIGNANIAKVAPEGSASTTGTRESETNLRHRLFSSNVGGTPLELTSLYKNYDHQVSLFKRYFDMRFDDAKVEKAFMDLQRRATAVSLKWVVVMLTLIELSTIVYDFFYSPGPTAVYNLRLVVCLLGILTKVGLAVILRKRPTFLQEKVVSTSFVLSLIQALSLIVTQHRRALAFSNVKLQDICAADDIEIADVYCDNNWADADSMLLLCLVVFLVSVSYSLGMVIVSTVTALNTGICYVIVSLALGVFIHYLDAAMLFGIGFICAGGSWLSEKRWRDWFDRTLISKEAIRRNRKLRASFDRHVDNEKTLLEQTQQLHEENKILRKKAEVLDESMESGVELESPLLSSIHELREVQRQAKLKGNFVIVDTLEKVIKNLQSRSLADIDISVTTKQSSALDAKTKEWLSDATSGWEQRRMKNRKLRTSSGSRPFIRESVTEIPQNLDQDLSAEGSGSQTFEDIEESKDGDESLPPSDDDNKANRGTTASALSPGKSIKGGCLRLDNGNFDQTDSVMFPNATPKFHADPGGFKTPLQEMLETADDWNKFDILGLSKTTKYPITALVDHAIQRQQTLDFVDISYSRLINFMQYVDNTYCYGQEMSQDAETRNSHRNPYHNNLHGADVVQSVFCFLNKSDSVYKDMSHIDLFSCVIAAAIHDYHHPGRTNQFLVTQGHPIAIQHNDQSPNERFHLSEAFRLISTDSCNFLIRLSLKQRLEIRQTIIDLVLATDLAQTMKYLSSFQLFLSRRQEKSKVFEGTGPEVLSPVREESSPGLSRKGSTESILSGGSGGLEAEESILLLQIAIKVADISHPARPLALHLDWSDKIQEEFFLQGDTQKAQGFNVDPLCDRDNININKAQMGFIDFVCRPLIQPFAEFISMPCLIENLVHNYKYWSGNDGEQKYKNQ